MFKVESKEDGCLYAVKKSRVRFRGEFDRYHVFCLPSLVFFFKSSSLVMCTGDLPKICIYLLDNKDLMKLKSMKD